MVTPSSQTTVQKWFDRLEYGCRYTTWRLFYQRDFNEWRAAQERQQHQNATTDAASRVLEPAPGTPAVPPPAAPQERVR
jgi:hypothetical protein